jgi:integrase
MQRREPGKVWDAAQLRTFLGAARGIGCPRSSMWRPTPVPGAGTAEPSVAGRRPRRQAETISGSAAFISGERIEGTTKSGRSRVVSIDAGTVQATKDHRQRQNADRVAAVIFAKKIEAA